MTKLELYRTVEAIRASCDILTSPPFDSKNLCTNTFSLNLTETSIKTPGLRGMSHIPSRTVILDSNLNAEEQNFYCMHEIMHHLLHRNRRTKVYSVYEYTAADQDPFVEWEANEGAAQFLVPYQTFIPDYINLSRKNARSNIPGVETRNELSNIYSVTQSVIATRIKNLNYEIWQYINGTPICSIDVRSSRYLERNRINVGHEKLYCRSCLAPVWYGQRTCHICGTHLHWENYIQRSKYTAEGAGYMEYPGIELDENGRATECPICHNTETSQGRFCMICGTSLLNECSATPYNRAPNCLGWMPGNARYCPHCGSKSTFFARGFLLPWDHKAPESLGSLSESDDGELPF